jgi:hypothetical protein
MKSALSGCGVGSNDWCVFASQYQTGKNQKYGKRVPLPANEPMTWRGNGYFLVETHSFANKDS